MKLDDSSFEMIIIKSPLLIHHDPSQFAQIVPFRTKKPTASILETVPIATIQGDSKATCSVFVRHIEHLCGIRRFLKPSASMRVCSVV